MTKEDELRQLVVTLASAMRPAGIVLSAVATSRSKHSEEAWAAFSQIVAALNLVRAVVERDTGGSVQ